MKKSTIITIIAYLTLALTPLLIWIYLLIATSFTGDLDKSGDNALTSLVCFGGTTLILLPVYSLGIAGLFFRKKIAYYYELALIIISDILIAISTIPSLIIIGGYIIAVWGKWFEGELDSSLIIIFCFLTLFMTVSLTLLAKVLLDFLKKEVKSYYF
jgi:hypothetical protein